MFTSRRFTTKLTPTTRRRLDAAIDNSRPISRRERDRGAVVAVQAALADLNRGYLSTADVDGHFGRITAAGVEAFQRDYGLYPDGIAGRQTLLELDNLFSTELFREPSGLSIHVGVNVVDTDHYGDAVTELAACVNDANDFTRMSSSLGYHAVTLRDEEATTTNFIAAMRQATLNLYSGDSLLVTFSGHGAQTPNTSADSEADGRDETLCFYDRMLLDDEVFCLLAELKPGVNVTMLYDSCHSATVTRGLLARTTAGNKKEEERFRSAAASAMLRSVSPQDPEDDEKLADQDPTRSTRFMPFAKDEVEKALDGDRAEQTEDKSHEKAIKACTDLLVEVGKSVAGAPNRLLDTVDAAAIYDRNRQTYEAIKSIVGNRENDHLECHVVAFSACQDNQTTLDGSTNGLYSGNVLRAWDDGDFTGSVRSLHRRLLSESPADITPAFHTYGGPRAEARQYERPFAF